MSEQNKPEASDMLDMAYINSLPQPLMARTGTSWWGVDSICVQTGLVRLDICGMPEAQHIGGIFTFRDDSGKEHDVDDFYLDSDRAIAAAEAQ